MAQDMSRAKKDTKEKQEKERGEMLVVEDPKAHGIRLHAR